MDSNQLNQTNIDHRGTQDDPNDLFQFSNLEKLTKIIEYNTAISSQEPIKDFLGIVLKAEWVPSIDDGFTEKDLANINTTARGAYRCVVRIPEVHSCIPEPKRPALQDPNNATGEPNFDDFYILMHDDFFVDRSGYKAEAMPLPGDIVVCDYKYRDVRLGGIIKKVHELRSGAGGGVISNHVSGNSRIKGVYDISVAKGEAKSYAIKEINPKYVGGLSGDEQKLEIVHPRLRAAAVNIRNELIASGFDEKSIRITSTWRDSNKQARLTNKSNPPNPTDFSYHIVIVEPENSDFYEPVAYAVDMSYPKGDTGTEKRKIQEKFYAKLGELVKKEGLTWGGTFKVRPTHSEYKKAREKNTGIGWDPQHMSMRDILQPHKAAIKSETSRIYENLGQTKLKK